MLSCITKWIRIDYILFRRYLLNKCIRGYLVILVSAYLPVFRGCFRVQGGYSAVKSLWVLFVLFSFKNLRIEVKYLFTEN